MKIFTRAALLLGISLLGTVQATPSPSQDRYGNFRFELGLGTRNQTPLVALGGISYKFLTFRLQGGGFHNEANDFWCGMRGSLLWSFFYDLPFNFDVGVGGGYEYAQAPNGMHQALNAASKAKYVRPYNYKENLDVSIELWAHLYGLYTQISVPAYQFKKHGASRTLWGTGYLYRF